MPMSRKDRSCSLVSLVTSSSSLPRSVMPSASAKGNARRRFDLWAPRRWRKGAGHDDDEPLGLNVPLPGGDHVGWGQGGEPLVQLHFILQGLIHPQPPLHQARDAGVAAAAPLALLQQTRPRLFEFIGWDAGGHELLKLFADRRFDFAGVFGIADRRDGEPAGLVFQARDQGGGNAVRQTFTLP